MLGALIGGGLSLLGGLMANESNQDINSAQMAFNAEQAKLNREFNAAEAEKTRTFNAGEAQTAREWQERLSNTQYQRSVSDMVAAGLNPMLAYMKGGAGVPSGAQASGPAASSSPASAGSMQRMENVLKDVAPSAAAVAVSLAQAEKLKAETRNVEADTLVKVAQEPNVRSQTDLNINSAGKVAQETENLRMEYQRIYNDIERVISQRNYNDQLVTESKARTFLLAVETELKEVEADYRRGQISKLVYETALVRAQSVIEQLRIAKERNLSAAEESQWKQNVAPFLDDAGKVGDLINPLKSLGRGIR